MSLSNERVKILQELDLIPDNQLLELSVIDTDILSRFFRGHEGVVSRFSSYLAVYDKFMIGYWLLITLSILEKFPIYRR